MFKLFKKFFSQGKYDLETLEGIQSIPIPKYPPLQGLSSPVNNIEYILQRKATEHKKNGRMDLAIACLKKSNEIFPHSNFSWAEKDYMRLVEFLKADRQFEEAKKEEENIRQVFSTTKFIHDGNKNKTNIIGMDEETISKVFGGLVESHNHLMCCADCAKYARRIFSIDGKDKRFPILPDSIKYYNDEHKYCQVSLSAFTYGISEPRWEYKGDLIKWSNRPYVDERTQEQKEHFEQEYKKHEEEELDKKFYDLIFEKIPEIAPKSFGGYRRMKSTNSDNYQKLLKKAEELLGYDFYSNKK